MDCASALRNAIAHVFVIVPALRKAADPTALETGNVWNLTLTQAKHANVFILMQKQSIQTIKLSVNARVCPTQPFTTNINKLAISAFLVAYAIKEDVIIVNHPVLSLLITIVCAITILQKL